ncbi:MAG TPA: BMP family ABC transporter substrate-binding protein [Candidatus Cottocaccamicrobium excrementipullorum]|nr:BMP family ABC transporter substrate-binding protein [Candidatus Cottocaccamicrobium excrementipullorum]
MALYDYNRAEKLGRKQYQASLMKGEHPYLPVLDDILSYTDIVSEVNLGLVDIPLNRIVGTMTQGRTNAFASNFMPLLPEKTEFAAKWSILYDHQLKEGIHDPIIAYEFMNKYYVQEGNKRVSVLKYLNAFSIPGIVTRLLPRRSDDKENKLYYEFLDFYQVSFNSDVWFSQEGSYNRLIEEMGLKPGEVWDEETRLYFKAVYDRFTKVFSEKGGNAIGLTASDAFLLYVEIYGYETIKEKTEGEIEEDLTKIWKELVLKGQGGKVALVEQPEEVKPQAKSFMNWLLPGSGEADHLKISFVYEKTPETSSWTYGHELGRLYLEQVFPGQVETAVFPNADTDEEIEKGINMAIAAGSDIIFTTTPRMIQASVKAAVEHPEVKILNCNVNTSYSSVRTYYRRMHEAKFLMGAIAAAMDQRGRLGYIADYPIYGSLANVNAFAIGARMINPRAQVVLKWKCVKDHDPMAELQNGGIDYISADDMITPKSSSREFGLFHEEKDGSLTVLATPICDWGKFYVRIVKIIRQGAWNALDSKGKQAVNYWWGMSADVIDVICSQNLPRGTHRLITFLKNSIRAGSFQPFECDIYSRDGVLRCSENRKLSPEEIVTMNWLAENVEGSVPEPEELTEEAQDLVKLQGIKLEKNTEAAEANHEDSGSSGRGV